MSNAPTPARALTELYVNRKTLDTALAAVAEALAELSNQCADDDLSPNGLEIVTEGREAMEVLGDAFRHAAPAAGAATIANHGRAPSLNVILAGLSRRFPRRPEPGQADRETVNGQLLAALRSAIAAIPPALKQLDRYPEPECTDELYNALVEARAAVAAAPDSGTEADMRAAHVAWMNENG